MMIVGLSGYLPADSVYAETVDPVTYNEEQFDETQFDDDVWAAEDRSTGSTEVLAFTSDVHNSPGEQSRKRLSNWVETIEGLYGTIDFMGFCGDMGCYNIGEDKYWGLARNVIEAMDSTGIKCAFTTGNHEYDYDIPEDLQARIQINEEVDQGAHYRVYCLGSEQFQSYYPLSQIAQLDEYLKNAADVQDDRPIIIFTHYPLHCYNIRVTENAPELIDVLNHAAARGQKIVFLWGHNHSYGDTYYDHMYVPGDSIEYGPGYHKTIQFYYGAAGCMSDSEYGSGSASVAGKGLVITAESNQKLSFAYYKADGEYLDSSQFTIRFADDNGRLLNTGRFSKGEIPFYPDGIPVKPENNQYTYTFTEWSDGFHTYGVNDALPEVKGPALYIAYFHAVAKPANPIQGVSGTLLAAMRSSGHHNLTFSWNRIQNADGYDVFLARCNGTHHYTRVLSLKGGNALKGKVKGLKKHTAYKGLVKAYTMVNGQKHYVRTSPAIRAYTTGGSKTITNPKSVKIGTTKVTLNKGKTYTIKAKVKKLKKGKKLIGKGHIPKVRYISSNTSIATVTGAGKVIAVSKGTCTVYAFAANGVHKAVSVTVR